MVILHGSAVYLSLPENPGRRRLNVVSGRSNNDPSERPLKRRRTVPESIKNVLSCGCLDDLQPSDSDNERPNTAAAQASLAEMAEILNSSARRQTRAQANVNVLDRIDRLPPPYVTPPSSNIVRSEVVVHPNAPRISPMRNLEEESERTSYVPDPSGRSYGRVVYSRVPASERFNFTPVNANSPLPNPSDTFNDSS